MGFKRTPRESVPMQLWFFGSPLPSGFRPLFYSSLKTQREFQVLLEAKSETVFQTS